MPIRHPVNKTLMQIRKRDWAVAVVAFAVALAAVVAGTTYGTLKGKDIHPKVIAWVSAGVLVVSGVFAVGRLSGTLSRLVGLRSSRAAEGAVRLLTTALGYLLVLLGVIAVLQHSIDHLLVGAGVAGVVIGIAAQQSLGNVFAGFVLLLARPYEVGDHIRVRSGALGGIFDAQVVETSLTYVTLITDDGNLKIPNSVMLSIGVGTRPPPSLAEPIVPPSPPTAVPPPTPATAPVPGPSAPVAGPAAVFPTAPGDRGGTVAQGGPPGGP